MESPGARTTEIDMQSPRAFRALQYHQIELQGVGRDNLNHVLLKQKPSGFEEVMAP